MYENNGIETIIISTNGDESNTESGIYEYDMNSNKINMICKYHEDFRPNYHSQVIDQKNEMMFTQPCNFIYSVEKNCWSVHMNQIDWTKR